METIDQVKADLLRRLAARSCGMLDVMRKEIDAGLAPLAVELAAAREACKILVAAFPEQSMDKLDAADFKDRAGETFSAAVAARAALHAAAAAKMHDQRMACDHPWHQNEGLITPCPECGAGETEQEKRDV